MAKSPKSGTAKGDMSSPAKGGGQKYKPFLSPMKKEGDKKNQDCESDASKWYMLWLGISQFL